MDLTVLSYTFADPDYYEPLDSYEDPSPAFRPGRMPTGWTGTRRGVWLAWEPPEAAVPVQGWKIHLSATFAAAPRVLDTVASVCAGAGVPFKHLRSEFAFLFMAHKHGARAQSGKFCVVYPPDESTTRQLLTELAAQLANEDGPFILSDRRFGNSRTVHYRYGGFRSHQRLRADGTTTPLVKDGTGNWVEDLRTPRFVLPPGISDPFGSEPAPAAAPDGGVWIGAYQVRSALVQSNAGGAYRATDTAGRQVFMKEAREHSGLFWDRSTATQRLHHEYEMLCELHSQAPGLAPEPVALFREWEHEFMVTEFITGRSLYSYAARNNPYALASTAADFEAYFQNCRGLLAQLREALDRLHELGYRFGDVNPRNMLVTDAGTLRLIDFETCTRLNDPPIMMGAPGYVPADQKGWEGTGADEYGFAAVALTLLVPVHHHLSRNPAGLAHLASALHRRHPVPADLWRLATRNVPIPARPASDATTRLPDPQQVADDPVGQLEQLRTALGRELAATATPDHPRRVWPTAPAGYAANTWCVAYGAAGVLHALHHAGLPVDPAVVNRVRQIALAQPAELPPGLHYGLAGIGWVLAEYGQLDEAGTVLDAARAHPLTAGCADWAGGAPGVGTALLGLHSRTGESARLEQAVRLGEQICAGDPAQPVGQHNPTGLLHGRAGIALFLHQLWRATGEKRFLRYGIGLLHAELDRAIVMRGGELAFHDDEVTPRAMPYLGIGSAGVGLVLTRYLHTGTDERLAAAIGPVLAAADKPLAAEPGLYQGLSGLAFAQAEHADLAGYAEPAGKERARQLLANLFSYAIPGPQGRVRFLGAGLLRFSCELYSGAAGVLLALSRVLDGPRSQFFTLDEGR